MKDAIKTSVHSILRTGFVVGPRFTHNVGPSSPGAVIARLSPLHLTNIRTNFHGRFVEFYLSSISICNSY